VDILGICRTPRYPWPWVIFLCCA